MPIEPVRDNRGASFHSVRRYKSAAIEPTVAKPHSPDNRATARECHGIRLDRAYIGSCTGGEVNHFGAAAPNPQGPPGEARHLNASSPTPRGGGPATPQ